ncbi:hypothetical protein EIP91_002555 [Steccherinum ochraceum]|uniref:Major facilitator superfamily (MFS) profile domain-containing protein n=1 Tax=Steccherinum ochraceum TaxID=92696 RepID=A0A4V2MWA7_9APHY|nr:hypothetical protein EIP91_002555 [Steccherinum ochraceum]
MAEHETSRRRRAARIILPYAFLQSFAASSSIIPTLQLFHDIKHRECMRTCIAHVLEFNPCDFFPTAYGPAATVFFSIIAVLSLLSAGSYGHLLDRKGIKMVMVISGLLNAGGDVWLYVCGQVPSLSENVSPSMFAAVLKGIGGAWIVTQAAHWTYVSFTATPKSSSAYFSVVLFTTWAGSASSVVISAVLVNHGPKYLGFVLAFSCWIAYVLAAAMLPNNGIDSSSNDPDKETKWIPSRFTACNILILLKAIAQPVVLMFHNLISGLLFAAYTCSVVALNIFDTMLSYRGQQSTFQSTKDDLALIAIPATRLLMALCLLPLLSVVHHRWVQARNRLTVRPFIGPDKPRGFVRDSYGSSDVHTSSSTTLHSHTASDVNTAWTQDIAIAQCCLLAGAVGVLISLVKQSITVYLVGACVASLMVPATPALTSLVVQKARPGELGSTLMGLAMIDVLAVYMRFIPIALSFRGSYVELTVPTEPILIAIMAVMITGCALVWLVKRRHVALR